MDILIQQDGRIQTNITIDPKLNVFRTIELASLFPYTVAHRQQPLPNPFQLPDHIERRYRKLGTEGDITVWVEKQ